MEPVETQYCVTSVTNKQEIVHLNFTQFRTKTMTVPQLQLILPTENLDRECLCMVIVYLISRYDRRYKEGLTHYRSRDLLWKIPWVSPTFALTPWALYSYQYNRMSTVC